MEKKIFFFFCLRSRGDDCGMMGWGILIVL